MQIPSWKKKNITQKIKQFPHWIERVGDNRCSLADSCLTIVFSLIGVLGALPTVILSKWLPFGLQKWCEGIGREQDRLLPTIQTESSLIKCTSWSFSYPLRVSTYRQVPMTIDNLILMINIIFQAEATTQVIGNALPRFPSLGVWMNKNVL